MLAGQPQLADRLNHPDLKQLKQRIALRCELRPLDLQETAAYIAGRIRIAGGDSTALFTREAVELIFHCSRGIPRTISVICDNALVGGFATDRRPVGFELVTEVCRDFDLAAPSQPAPANAPAASTDLHASVLVHPDRMPTIVEPEKAPAAGPASSLFSSFTRRRRFSFF